MQNDVMNEPSLDNGAVVVAASPWRVDSDNVERRIVLCAWRSQWVTWAQFRKSTGETSLCWGHYWSELEGESALCDFNKRSKGL